jgi:hypothetical protein
MAFSQILRLLTLLYTVPVALAAQGPGRFRGPRATVGGQLGYSRSSLGGPDAQGLSSHQGALSGVYLQLPVGGPVSFRPELLFALKGGRAQAAVVGGGVVDIDIGLAYLELPALLRIERPTGRFRPVLFGGPSVALQIGCDLQVIDPSNPFRAECDQQVNVPAFRQFDLGLVVGTGIEVRWPGSALSLEARYMLGFRSVLEEVDIRNRAVGVLVAMTF